MSRTFGNKDFWLTALRAEGSAFLTAIRQDDAISQGGSQLSRMDGR